MYSQYPQQAQDPHHQYHTHSPAPQYLQPSPGMTSTLQYSASARPPSRSLSPLPQSHNELRARLEAAGVAPDQIASVLLSQPTSQLERPPALPARPSSSHSNYAANPPPSYGYGLPNTPAAQQPEKLVYEVHNLDWKEVNGTVYCTVAFLAPGASMTQPTYTAVHTCDSATYDNQQLRFYRHDRNGKTLFNTCRFYSQTSEIQIEEAATGVIGGRWDPDKQYFASSCGTLGQAAMEWTSYWQDPHAPRCVATTTGENFDGTKSTNIGANVETCRVTWLDKASARSRIELPTKVFQTQDQLDEMVAFAMIQLTREVAELKEASTATAGKSEKKSDKIKASTWMELAKAGMEFVSAVQGS